MEKASASEVENCEFECCGGYFGFFFGLVATWTWCGLTDSGFFSVSSAVGGD